MGFFPKERKNMNYWPDEACRKNIYFKPCVQLKISSYNAKEEVDGC